MGYTKGKWEVDKVGDCSLIMADDRTCVARTYLTYYPEESATANAHLIAAAPAMYEALEATKWCLAHRNMKGGVNWEQLDEDIQEALALARRV